MEYTENDSSSSDEDGSTVRPNAPASPRTEIWQANTPRNIQVASIPTGSADEEDTERHESRQRAQASLIPEISKSQHAGISDTQEGWFLEYERPPATSFVLTAPLTYFALQERLGLDDEAVGKSAILKVSYIANKAYR